MLNIQPIKLLAGAHEDTFQTGQGCFMNVAAYLNGDLKMSDKSPCVSPIIRNVAIFLNDMLNDEDRQRLIPLIPRAMETGMNSDAQIAAERVKLFEVLFDLWHGTIQPALKENNVGRAGSRQKGFTESGTAFLKGQEDAMYLMCRAEQALKEIKRVQWDIVANEEMPDGQYEEFTYKAIKPLTDVLYKYLCDVLPENPIPTEAVVSRAKTLVELAEHG